MDGSVPAANACTDAAFETNSTGQPVGDETDVTMHETMSSTYSLLSENSPNRLFPSLRAPPPEWREDLLFMLENVGRNYLTDMSTEFTQEACARLPSLVNTMVQTLSRISGGLISARSVVFDYEDRANVKAYSTMTEDIQGCMSDITKRDDMAFFIDMAFRATGQGFEREPAKINPQIYTSPSWKGRPILCPKHPDLTQRRSHLLDWMSILQVWQGLTEMSSEAIATSVSEGNLPPFAPDCMPANLRWNVNIDDWSKEEIDTLYDWILSHQRRISSGDTEAERTAPQFLENHIDKPLRKEGQPVSGNYSYLSAYYFIAMQHFQFPDEAYLSRTPEAPRWFHPKLLANWHSILTPELNALIPLVEVNELMSPHKRSPNDSDPPLLLLMPEHETLLDEFINNFTIPELVNRWDHPDYASFSMPTLWRFVGLDKALCKNGKVAGGRTGAMRVTLLLIALRRLKLELQAGKIESTEGTIIWGVTKDHQLAMIASALANQIQESIDSVWQPSIYRGNIEDQWAPNQVTMKFQFDETPFVCEWPYGHFGKHEDISWVIGLMEDSPNAPEAVEKSKIADLEHTFDPILADLPPSPFRKTPVPVQPASGDQLLSLSGSFRVPQPLPQGVSTSFLPAPVPLLSQQDAAVIQIDSDDDNPWQPIKQAREAKKPVQLSSNVPTAASSGLTQPLTEKIQTANLPDKTTATRRSQSLDPAGTKDPRRPPAKSILGLQVPKLADAAWQSGLNRGDVSFGFPTDESTPHAPSRSASVIPSTSQHIGGSVSSGPGMGHQRTVSSSSSHRSRGKTPVPDSAHSRTSSGPVGAGDQTATGSILDMAARAFTSTEAKQSSTGQTREPAVSVAPRKMPTRAATTKRAHPEEGTTSHTPGAKKTRSSERGAKNS